MRGHSVTAERGDNDAPFQLAANQDCQEQWAPLVLDGQVDSPFRRLLMQAGYAVHGEDEHGTRTEVSFASTMEESDYTHSSTESEDFTSELYDSSYNSTESKDMFASDTDDNSTAWLITEEEVCDSVSEASTKMTGATSFVNDLPTSIDFGQLVQRAGTLAPAAQQPVAPLLRQVDVHALGSPQGEVEVAVPHCPFCLSSIISPHGASLRTDGSYFAKRRNKPRPTPRRQNRLAAWYSKYGYVGPSYCKACSEAFHSHLLRQAARPTKDCCSRQVPCDSCSLLLSHFTCTPQQLYAKVDARQKTYKPKAKHNRRSSTHLEQRPCADDHATATHSAAQHKSRKRRRRAGAWLAATVAVATIFVVGGYGGGDGSRFPTLDPSVRRDGPSWVCPSTPSQDSVKATTSSPVGVLLYSPQSCNGKNSSHEFTCNVNECSKSGLVSVGDGLCRCDGCIYPGRRCGGWTLLGQRRHPQNNSAAVCEGGTDAAAWPDSAVSFNFVNDEEDVEDTNFHQPSDVIMWISQSYPLSADTERVWLLSFDSGTSKVDLVTTNSGEGSHSSGEKWWEASEKTFDDSLGAAGGQKMANANSGAKQARTNTIKLWFFELQKGSWSPCVVAPSSREPASRSSSAWWSDSTGALFIFGGVPNTHGMNGSVMDTSVGGSEENRDIWRFDTIAQTWTQILCEYSLDHGNTSRSDDRTAASQKLPSRDACQLWPSPRMAHTMWSEIRDAAPTSADQQESVVWMFGGVDVHTNFGRHKLVSSSAVATELWRLTYRYTQDGKVTGLRWLLVTANNNRPPPLPEPIFSCQAVESGDVRLRDCPAARSEAGSWRANDKQGGWIFGGYGFDFVGILGYYVIQDRLSDLWYFNGDAESPRWQQYLASGDGTALWPPGWNSAVGWEAGSASFDDSGVMMPGKAAEEMKGQGELWVVGGTGGQDADGGTIDEAIVDRSTASLWRFSIASGTWETIQLNDYDTRAQPAPRTRACAVALRGGHSGLLFGGLGQAQCESAQAGRDQRHEHEELSPAGKLSSLWRWDS